MPNSVARESASTVPFVRAAFERIEDVSRLSPMGHAFFNCPFNMKADGLSFALIASSPGRITRASHGGSLLWGVLDFRVVPELVPLCAR